MFRLYYRENKAEDPSYKKQLHKDIIIILQNHQE